MNLITTEEIVAAFEKTGYKPNPLLFCSVHFKDACALGAICIARDPSFTERYDKFETTIAEELKIDDNDPRLDHYSQGFYDGFKNNSPKNHTLEYMAAYNAALILKEKA